MTAKKDKKLYPGSRKHNKVYSLCINVQKLRKMKAEHGGTVTHLSSPQWELFYKKRHSSTGTRIRFFDRNQLESATFTVIACRKEVLLGERIIRITVVRD